MITRRRRTWFKRRFRALARPAVRFHPDGGGQGKDFLYRYFPLAAVVGWKFVVAMVVAAWALNQVLAGQPEHVTRWSVVALGCLGNALMFLRIGQHLKALSRRAR